MAGTVAHFEKQELEPLASNVIFKGPGIYALYYKGGIPEYRPIANRKCPIYIGKAVPPGARKGGEGDVNVAVLQRRIREHARSITAAKNLELNDFSFRALAIVPVWIVFAEQALIKQYHPVWNTCLEGFGKHNQGINRLATKPSWWDTLHPGRSWAAQPMLQRGQDDRTEAKAKRLIRTHFRKHPIS
ncbi:MAG: Eco29kI family restriction endonuclease [Bryobacterales bacterium]|nr:Eco29kI family restriction endonuclease [Bryobacterales bacterium]